MKQKSSILFLMVFAACGQTNSVNALTSPDHARVQGAVALVYDGPGACPEDCAKASADSAKAAGLTPLIVGPNALTNSSTDEEVANFFRGVRVWIQPGGYARNAFEAMSPRLRAALKEFIRSGGGYVGFCAGAFMTTEEIGTTGAPGLGIFPGKSAPLGATPGAPGYHFSIEQVSWFGGTRAIYYEGGPYLYNLDSSVEVVSEYKNGSVAAARTLFGYGRVFIAGPHPEAPIWWSSGTPIRDQDGVDIDIAASMIRWSAHLE